MMIPILMYHQIAAMPEKGTPFRGLSVPPEKFRSQMQWLKRLGYQGLSMRDLEPYLRGEKHGRVVGITFDDGYQNVLQNALPVLQECGFTSTTYFVAGHAPGHNYWDEEKGVPRSDLMSIREIEQWRDGGQEIGSHTLDHVHLTQLPIEQAEHQIKESKRILEALYQVPVTAFCYPYGDCNQTIFELTQKAGYTNATTIERGLVLETDDLYCLPRVTIAGSLDLFSFFMKVLTKKEHRHRLKKQANNGIY